jgi:hypothetical protein
MCSAMFCNRIIFRSRLRRSPRQHANHNRLLAPE